MPSDEAYKLGGVPAVAVASGRCRARGLPAQVHEDGGDRGGEEQAGDGDGSVTSATPSSALEPSTQGPLRVPRPRCGNSDRACRRVHARGSAIRSTRIGR